jgi:hypothetical protein
MRTVYAVRVSGPRSALRPQAQALVVGWLEAQFPYDDRSAGTSVRVVDEARWFRVVVDQHLDAEITSQTVVALRSDERGLAFEARQTIISRQVRVVRRAVPPANGALLRMVRLIVDLIGTVDAGVPVTSQARVVDSEIEAAGVAALCDAPSRSLPVVVETARVGGDRIFRAEAAGPALAGLAHVVVLTDDRTRRAFNDAWGADLLGVGALTVVWPDRGQPDVSDGSRLTEQGARRELVHRIEQVIAAAATSLPVLPRPRPPSTSRADHTTSARTVTVAPDPEGSVDPSIVDPGSVPAAGSTTGPVADPTAEPGEEMVTLGELLGVLDELEQAWNRVDDLQGAVAAADAMVADATARRALLESQIDDLVRAKVDLEIRQGRRPDTLTATGPADALNQARSLCRHLEFAGDYRDIGELTGVDSSALLVDLVKLDSVAVQWMAGDITDTTFALACRNVGLDYASDVSDTARNEYAEDYSVRWQGKVVLARAHLRRGKGVHHYRIHLYLDRETRRVVVGHIGRHLRGKRS